MVHHQSDMSPTLLEVLRQLQAKATWAGRTVSEPGRAAVFVGDS